MGVENKCILMIVPTKVLDENCAQKSDDGKNGSHRY